MAINYWYEFSKINNIKPFKKYQLIEYFKTPSLFFNATDSDILHSRCVTKKQLLDIRKIVFNQKGNQYLENNNIQLLTIYDDLYPVLLKEIYDPPVVLFYRGNKKLFKMKKMAVVGSRKHSTYGEFVCKKIARILSSEQYVVVSGMAKGIDTIAHQHVLFNDTIAVLGFGFNYCYPREHINLKRKLENLSLVITEYPPATKPSPYNFPARNRIISGLCIGTVIVEAAIRSGSLITANFTIENNRELYVVPHNITSNSLGSNLLIKDGANIITSFDGFLNEIKNLEIT